MQSSFRPDYIWSRHRIHDAWGIVVRVGCFKQRFKLWITKTNSGAAPEFSLAGDADSAAPFRGREFPFNLGVGKRGQAVLRQANFKFDRGL
jgi:hypothetical protein